jgi:hypothetical protein
MDSVVAKIYIILSVTTILLFILTRKVHFRIKKDEHLIFSIGFILFKLELTKNQGSFEEKTEIESGIPPEIDEVFSLISILLSYTKKCTITLHKLSISLDQPTYTNPMLYFGLRAVVSSFIAYIDSRVEKLTIADNAFILDPDRNFIIDIDIGIGLFNLIILAARLIAKGIKMGKAEDTYVRN